MNTLSSWPSLPELWISRIRVGGTDGVAKGCLKASTRRFGARKAP
jgi:glutaredoxin-related protein